MYCPLPPPGLTKYHPQWSYRLRPFSLSLALTQLSLLPSIATFDLLLIPQDQSHPALCFLSDALSHVDSLCQFADNCDTIVRKYTSSTQVRSEILSSLKNTYISWSLGQREWINQFGTDLPTLWKKCRSLKPRQAILTFLWRLLNRGLPTGTKTKKPCALCGGKETSEHLFTPECAIVQTFRTSINNPLQCFLSPPYDNLLACIIDMWTIWLVRNAALHENTNTPALLFPSLHQRELSRHQHLHHPSL